MKMLIIIFVVSILSLFSEITVPSAFAYLDAGSGTMIIQMLLGVLVGVFITLKVFWLKIKLKLFSKFKNKSNN
jgi:hypothetical protein